MFLKTLFIIKLLAQINIFKYINVIDTTPFSYQNICKILLGSNDWVVCTRDLSCLYKLPKPALAEGRLIGLFFRKDNFLNSCLSHSLIASCQQKIKLIFQRFTFACTTSLINTIDEYCYSLKLYWCLYLNYT